MSYLRVLTTRVRAVASCSRTKRRPWAPLGMSRGGGVGEGELLVEGAFGWVLELHQDAVVGPV